MPSFPLLDIAIGLAFIYLLLSLICSSINEGIESFLRNRANDLEGGIRKMLGDGKGSWWASMLPVISSIKESSITREFYRHPLIRSLYQKESRLPTYIPSRNFALAVMDMVTVDSGLLKGATKDSPAAVPGNLAFAGAINGVAIPDSLKMAIDTLVTAAAGDPKQARINIENWFNSSMDRVSGWYKARTQKILFVIGMAVTIAVNADSIAIFKNLSHSKNLQSIVSAAEKTAGQPLPSGKDPNDQINDAMTQLKGLDIGIGWDAAMDRQGTLDPIAWIVHLLSLHFIGWMITASALSLGAPFWFDTLNRFVTVRSTVKPKQPANDGGSSSQPA